MKPIRQTKAGHPSPDHINNLARQGTPARDPFADVPGIVEARAVIRPLLQSDTFTDKFGYLWSRWQDEKEYEDWKEYVKVMEKMMPAGVKLLKFTSRPFEMHMQHEQCKPVTFKMKLSRGVVSMTSHPTTS